MTEQIIYVIDDDLEICAGLSWLFESVNFKVETYSDPYLFLDSYKQDINGCIIIDVQMPLMNGLDLLDCLKTQKNRLPVIVITGYGDINMAIRAMKAGAADFVLKPFNDECLLEIAQKYLNSPSNSKVDEYSSISERVKKLTPREKQIMDLIFEGKLNKEIAYELTLSISTVEVHRANIMRKLQVKNLAQLIKLYFRFQYENEPLRA